MFDQVVTRPRARWPKTALIVGSAAVHAVGIATLAVVAMWQVDKLPIRELPPLLVQAPRLPAGAEAPRAGTRLDVPPRTTKIKVKDTVQPTRTVTEPAVAPSTGGEPGAGPAGPGDGPACEGPQCADLPPCAEPPCEPVPDPDPVVEPPPDPPPPVVHDTVTLPPTMAKGLRIAGDEQVFPDRTVALAMLHDGKSEVRGTFKLCVGEDGQVTSVRKMVSTGYDPYDQALTAAMQGWRYRPYLVDGTPAPMCTVQLFVYRIRS